MSLLTALLDLEDAATYDGDTPYLTRDQVTSVLPFQLFTKTLGQLRTIEQGTRAEVKWEARRGYGYLTVTIFETLTDGTLWTYSIRYTVTLNPTLTSTL